ncbi:MAG: DUF6174 domain-containing protein [Actinomycetota bacterium]
MIANNQTSVLTPSPTPLEFPKGNKITAIDENFKQEWQDKYKATVAEMERNRQLWQESKILNYDFVCQQFAGGMNGWGEVKIKARENKAVSIEKTEKDSLAKIDGYENFDTIDKIFDFMRQKLDEGSLVSVKYNKDLGYPEQIRITYSFNVDALFGVAVKKIEIIK